MANRFTISFYTLKRAFKELPLLKITTLHNSIRLSTLSISSHDFAFGFPKMSRTNGDVFLTYKPMINPLINRCGTPLPTIFHSNKVHNRASPKAYGALEQSTPFVQHFSHFWLHLWGSQLHCSTFENFIDMTKLRAWLNHNPPQWYDIVHFQHKLSSFAFGFPKRPRTNGDVFLTYKPMINPLISRCGTPPPTILNIRDSYLGNKKTLI